MRSRVMLLVVLVSLVVVSCGAGESTDTSPSATAATTSAPTVETDVAFATYNGEPFTLDLYVPTSKPTSDSPSTPAGLSGNQRDATTRSLRFRQRVSENGLLFVTLEELHLHP